MTDEYITTCCSLAQHVTMAMLKIGMKQRQGFLILFLATNLLVESKCVA